MRVRNVAFVGGVLILGALTGCGGKKSAGARTEPDPELRTIAQAPAPASAPATKPVQYRTARSQAEIDALYSGGAKVARPVAPVAPPAARPTLPLDDGRITADPSWDVTITRDWRHIVVHHSAGPTGSAMSFDRAHKDRGWDGLGYHFVIGNGSGSGDGEVEVGYRWRDQMQGAHAGNVEYNQHGIGICLVGNFEGSYPSPRQMASLRQLVRYLQVKTGIPTSEVIGHNNVPGKSTDCPGARMDLAAFRASLGGNAIPVPIHFTRASGGSAKASRTAPIRTGGAAMP